MIEDPPGMNPKGMHLMIGLGVEVIGMGSLDYRIELDYSHFELQGMNQDVY